MHKTKMFKAALILYLCIVVWGVLLSREPSDSTVIKFHSETIQFLLGNYPNWQSDATALHPEAMIQGDILNIILFIPIGLFTEAILTSKRGKFSLFSNAICGLMCSLMIEVAQLFTRRGWFDMDDLLMNMLGSIVGGTLYLLLKRLLRDR